MLFPTGAGEFDLLLALAEPGAVFVGELIHALVALHTGLVFLALHVFGGDWPAAGVAELVWAFFQPVTDGDAAVEDEAFAGPGGGLFGNLFEVFEDATFEVEDVLDAFAEQVVGGLRCLLCCHQSGNSPKLLVCGSMAPSNVPMATS